MSMCAANGLRVLIYPYGHCLNSHLLNAEKMARVLARYGHQVSVIVNNRYPTLGHVANRHHAPSDQSSDSSSSSREQGGYVEMIMFDAPQNFHANLRVRHSGLCRRHASVYSDFTRSLRRLCDTAIDCWQMLP
jgi:hypothetical protein